MMKRSIVVCAALALSITACDDDDDAVVVDAAPDAPVTPDAAPPAAGMCKGAFSSLNRTMLGQATPSGACAAPADLDIICNNDVTATTRACGQSCLITAPTTLEACVTTCVAMTYSLTPGCAGCYRASVACTIQQCLTPCQDTSSAACLQCQVTNGCISGFFTCSGLPSGMAAPDGGGSDAGGDAGADAGAEDAGAVDAPVPATDAAPDVAPAPDAPAPDAAVDATVG